MSLLLADAGVAKERGDPNGHVSPLQIWVDENRSEHTYIHTMLTNPPSRIAHLRSTTTTTSGSKPVRRDPSSPLAPLLLQTRNWQKKKTLGTDPMAWRP